MCANKAIGLLGGTFDPVHNGHIAIAKSFLNSRYIDSLVVLLTPHPPHKTRELTPYSQRLDMLAAAFKDIKGIQISDIEFLLPKPSYTYQTIHYFKKEHPEADYYLCLGEDSLMNFKQWKNWQGIIAQCELLVVKRPHTDNYTHDEQLLAHTHFIEHNPVEISSSEVRGRITSNKPVNKLVPDAVNDVIEEHRLYHP